MNHSVDDGNEMNIPRGTQPLSEADAEALLSGRAVAGNDDLREIIGLMIMASAVAAPTPNTALATMLDHGFVARPVESASRGSRWGRRGLRASAATTAALSVVLGAATANALPAPVQSAVADVVGAVTPLQLPRPEAGADNGSTDRDAPDEQPVEVPRQQSNDDPVTGVDEPTTETGETAPSMPEPAPQDPKTPAVITPLRPERAGATPTNAPAERQEQEEQEEPEEPEELEADDPEVDELSADENEAGRPGNHDSDGDLLEVPEAELDVGAEPETEDDDRDS